MNSQGNIATIEQFIERIRAMFSDKQRADVEFLKAQVRTLLEIVGNQRILLNDEQRARLAKAGLETKDSLAETSLIFKPETILKWHRALKAAKWNFSKRRKATQGRPPTAAETEALVVTLARENTWGYDRIVGELAKLGHTIAPTTVRNLLRKHGLPTSPNRKGMSWKTFIQSHLATTWAADFFTDEVWTLGGLATFYVLFFIHLKTRRIHIAGCTLTPNTEWVSQQARNFFLVHTPPVIDNETRIKYLIHDNDASFHALDKVFKSEAVEIVKTPFQSPNCNAYAERFVREARETLDNLILVGQTHLEHILRQIQNHHNSCRPHQGIENHIPLGYEYPDQPAPPKKIRRKAFLGGLLNHYYVDKAA
jgi:putative transposase